MILQKIPLSVAAMGMQGRNGGGGGGQFAGAVEQRRLDKGCGAALAGDRGAATQGAGVNGGEVVALHLQHNDVAIQVGQRNDRINHCLFRHGRGKAALHDAHGVIQMILRLEFNFDRSRILIDGEEAVAQKVGRRAPVALLVAQEQRARILAIDVLGNGTLAVNIRTGITHFHGALRMCAVADAVAASSPIASNNFASR